MNQKFKKMYEYYGNRLFWHLTKKYIIKSAIDYIQNSKQKKINILDLGGASGIDLYMIRLRLEKLRIKKEIKYTVIDRDFSFYKNFKKYDFIDYKEIDFINYTDVCKYDIVICSEVVEHLWDREKEVFFKKLNQIMNTEGLLILTTPNGSSILKNIRALLYKNNFNLLNADYQNQNHHIGVFTIFETLSILNRKGFYVKNIKSTTFYEKMKEDLFGKIINTIMWIPLLNKLISTNLVYIAYKNKEIDLNKWYNNCN